MEGIWRLSETRVGIELLGQLKRPKLLGRPPAPPRFGQCPKVILWESRDTNDNDKN